MSNRSPTQAQIMQVQTNLKHMQKLNDYVYNQGQSKVSNAYLLLSQTDSADPGMTVAVDILRGAFLALGKLLPVGGAAATFMAGMVADWATSAPPNLNTTFASLLTRLQASSLAVDQQLATYHQDVAGNWGTQFSDNGQTKTLADLASVVINKDGLFARKTVFNDLGISQTTFTVDAAPIAAQALSLGYLRAMKSGKTIGRLVEREGRDAVQQRIIERAHEDAVFATSLRHRPRQTLESFLGVRIPATVTIRVVLESPRSFTVVVPHRSREGE